MSKQEWDKSKDLEKELEKDSREEDMDGYFYCPNRFAIRRKSTNGLCFVGDRLDIIIEWNNYYAGRPHSSEYFVEIDHKSIDYSYHKLPKGKNIEVTVTKDGDIKFLNGSYV